MANWWQRALLVIYPLTMAFSLMYTGEHYFFDIFLGWVYAGAVYGLVMLYERVRDARGRTEPAPAAQRAELAYD